VGPGFSTGKNTIGDLGCLVQAEAQTYYKNGVGTGIRIDFFDPDSDPDPEMASYNVPF